MCMLRGHKLDGRLNLNISRFLNFKRFIITVLVVSTPRFSIIQLYETIKSHWLSTLRKINHTDFPPRPYNFQLLCFKSLFCHTTNSTPCYITHKNKVQIKKTLRPNGTYVMFWVPTLVDTYYSPRWHKTQVNKRRLYQNKWWN